MNLLKKEKQWKNRTDNQNIIKQAKVSKLSTNSDLHANITEEEDINTVHYTISALPAFESSGHTLRIAPELHPCQLLGYMRL